MSIFEIKNSLYEAKQCLSSLIECEDTLENIQKASDLMVECIKRKGHIYSCGNGGSSCDAMHFAEEMTGRYRDSRPALPAFSMLDSANMSCISNDFGYKFVFARYIEAAARLGDVLLAISTSGNSENIIEAANVAKDKGVSVIVLTGNRDSKLGKMADIVIETPAGRYADRVQELHIKVIHILIEQVERSVYPNLYKS